MPKRISEANFNKVVGAIAKHPKGIGLEELHSSFNGLYSRRTLQRWLRSLAEIGRVETVGQGPATVYRPPLKLAPPIPGHIGAIPILAEAAQRVSNGDSGREVTPVKPASNEVLSQELLALDSRPELLDQLVAILFRGAIPVDKSFYDLLERFRQQFEFGDNAQKIVAIVWEQASRRLNETQVENLMLILTTVGHSFWILLGSLPRVMATYRFTPLSFVRWCEAMLKRIGEDLGGQGFGDAVVVFCESRPAIALEVLKLYPVGQSNAGLVAAILGTLRRQRQSDLRHLVAIEEERFRDSGNPLFRTVYFQSWTQDARAGQLSAETWDLLVVCARKKGPEDIDLLVHIACAVFNFPQLATATKHHLLQWLLTEVSSTTSDLAKFRVAQLASFQRSTNGAPIACKEEICQLVLSILPVKNEHKATWDSIEFYLTSLIPSDYPIFERLCKALTRQNGEAWLSRLKTHPGMPGLLSQMKLVPQVELVTDLCISSERFQRHVGLYFFDELNVDGLEKNRLGKAKSDICWLLLHEIQAATISGSGAARCLISLLTQIPRMGERFAEVLKEELIIEAKNYPGECGEIFAARSSEHEFLKDVTTIRAKYFEALQEAKQSSLWKMEVPGYRRAVIKFSRNFKNEVERGAKNHSVFFGLIQEVQILYGKSWSTFVGDKLSPPAGLSLFDHSVEIPRLELIEPEQMHFRRLLARHEIASLENKQQTPKL